jgi:hypothetical protein
MFELPSRKDILKCLVTREAVLGEADLTLLTTLTGTGAGATGATGKEKDSGGKVKESGQEVSA